MSEQPRPGDRVRVTFEGRWTGHADEIEQDNGRVIAVDMNTETVEVVEPADDPSKELDGSVRKDPEFEKPDRVVVAVHPVRDGGPRWRSVSGDYYRRDEEVIGWTRLAPVPGTPAAEAQTPLIDAGPGRRPVVKPVPSQAGWEPRVFQADGPEPPEDVKALRYLDGNPSDRWPYLVHTRSGWVWTTSPDEDVTTGRGSYWDDATRACPGRYREVQP